MRRLTEKELIYIRSVIDSNLKRLSQKEDRKSGKDKDLSKGNKGNLPKGIQKG